LNTYEDWDGDCHVATLLAMTQWGWGLPSRCGGIVPEGNSAGAESMTD